MNNKEKEKIYEWACNTSPNAVTCFKTIDKMCESYYESRNDEQYIKEYSYQTVTELKQELEDMWGNSIYMKEVMQYVLVAAIRNKPKEKEDMMPEYTEKNGDQIKPYIYNF